MKKPKYSIIIPTKDRVMTLKHTLLTCINQRNFDDYEIIISDNECTDNTEEMVKELKCEKIKYVKTAKLLTMQENFEFALKNSSGQYKIILGSDDGLILHCLYVLNRIVSITGEDVLNWGENYYYWPDIEDKKNKLFIDGVKYNSKIIDGVNLIKK